MLEQNILIDNKIWTQSGTKAETLLFLSKTIKTAQILPLFFFTVQEWEDDCNEVLNRFRAMPWSQNKLIVRSSAQNEDSIESSFAGRFLSVMNVQNEIELIDSINQVIASYAPQISSNQVLIQPQLENVILSGVAFGRDPNTNTPYFVINYDDKNQVTNSITSGAGNYNTFFWHQNSTSIPSGPIKKIIELLLELKELYETDSLDIEFAISAENEIYLFQTRPLVMKSKFSIEKNQHADVIERIAKKIASTNKPHPYLYGSYTLYGIMPDWNPAEIIGLRPKPLALSLYRDLITNAVWAYQRDNYGYRNLRGFPLLFDFEGLPYIDVRVSFNSFLPKDLPEELCERLINYYLNRLSENPALHDKVEFEIVFSCYTLDLFEKLTILKEFNFSSEDCLTLGKSLLKLTNRIIHNKNGLWKKDLEKIYELQNRQKLIASSDLNSVSKMYWLLEDCKRYGTLPFAGLARAGFIAVQLLKSFVAANIISEFEYGLFFSSLDTVSSKINQDYTNNTKENFLEIYGHLRPGTYDILSPRYDEEPDMYFDWNISNKKAHEEGKMPFSLNMQQLRAIQEKINQDGLNTNVLDLLEFIKTAIEAREFSKFVFTLSVSNFLKSLGEFCNRYNINKEDASYLDVNLISMLYSSSTNAQDILQHFIKLGKERYTIAKTVVLPPLLSKPEEAWSFHYPETLPNFITQKSCLGHVVTSIESKDLLKGAILMIPSADPGYDWIFSHNIAGLITQFGGVNSHMAIRAGELEIPSIIGAGEMRYTQWCKAKKLKIDAANKKVDIL